MTQTDLVQPTSYSSEDDLNDPLEEANRELQQLAAIECLIGDEDSALIEGCDCDLYGRWLEDMGREHYQIAEGCEREA